MDGARILFEENRNFFHLFFNRYLAINSDHARLGSSLIIYIKPYFRW
jgi:hypothetical protein